MGILGMTKLIADIAPETIKEIDLKSLFGRRIAIDASMCIYQFLIAIRSDEYMMTNDSGETTSHLVGLFYRSIKLLETGIKPVFVFDGKAPKLKCGELLKRAERRNEAKEKLEEAKELQNIENIQRFNKRLVRVTRKMTEDCKRLLELLGIPIVQAPSEAEAQCVQLCKDGLVYAAATEDMDSLTLGCPRLIRNLTSVNNEKVKELQISKILDAFGLTQDQFIDLSILMGCDYCDNIKGIGGKKGLDLIRKFDNIETILKEKFGITEYVDVEVEYNQRSKEIEVKEEVKGVEEEIKEDVKDEANDEISSNNDNENKLLHAEGENKNPIKEESDLTNEDPDFEPEENEDDIDQTNDIENETTGKTKKPKRKVTVPENWPFLGARKLFKEPLVTEKALSESDFKFKEIDENELINFLCKEHGFSEDRVSNAIKRAKEAKKKSSQTRIDSFFKTVPSNAPSGPKNSTSKRNGSETKNKQPAKRGRRGR